MDKRALGDLVYITAFFLGGLVMAVTPLVLPYLLAPRRTRSVKQKTLDVIECGMETIGPAWIRYSVVYYLYALIFIGFAVDVLFLFPVAVVYGSSPGWSALAEIALFVGILALVIVYAWRKDIFTWKRNVKSPSA